MFKSNPFSAVFIASVVVCVFGQATIPCTYTDPSAGYTYDLSALANGTYDYYVEVPAGTDPYTTTSYQIVLNVCRPVKDQMCAPQGGQNVDACQEWPIPNPVHYSAVGSTASTTLGQGQDTSGEYGEGVTMYYGGFQSTVQINFVCDPTSGAGFPRYVTKPTSYTYLLQWKSKYGCAESGTSKSRVFCDCEKADVTLCAESPCPTDVNDLCNYECFQFGGVQNAANNYCNYNTNSDICA